MYQNGVLFERDFDKSKSIYIQVQAETQERKDLQELVASNLKLLDEKL
jgi:hypothetical protein